MHAFDHVLNWRLKVGSHLFPGPDGGTCINEAALVAAGFEYQPVRIDDALLTNIARMTGGRYFRARDATALRNIYAQIDLLERTPVRSTTVVNYSELYRWPLMLGIILLLAEAGLVAWRAPLP